MIKILFFVEKLAHYGSIGGAEKVLISLVNNMDSDQFDITVCTLFPEKEVEQLNKNIHYRYAYPERNGFFQKLYRLEAETGIFYKLHLKDNYNIEVAYLESGPTKVIASSTNKNAKKVAWIHCDFDIAIKNKHRFVSKQYKYYSKFDKIVCVSEKCKNSFILLFGDTFDVSVVHNVIDSNEILSKAQEELNITESTSNNNDFNILAVGRFSAQKNILRLLKSFNRLVTETENSGLIPKLWLVGDGDERKQIEAYIKENNLVGSVTLFGFKSNPYPFMKKADLLVCSSNYEGYSTFATEAVILEKPFLTTDCSGMHEILGKTLTTVCGNIQICERGIITENRDTAFYQGLSYCFDNYLKQNRVIDINSADKPFSLENLTACNEEFFKSLLN